MTDIQAPGTDEIDDMKSCIRFLSKIIRERGNWEEDEANALEWAQNVAGLYEEELGEDGDGTFTCRSCNGELSIAECQDVNYPLCPVCLKEILT